MPRGAGLFGGWWNDNVVTVSCDGDDPNTFLYCDQSELDIPFRNSFKLAGAAPLPFGVELGASFISYAGEPLAVNWTVPANLFPGGRTQSVTARLIPPGTKYLKQWNQVDVSFKKVFTFGQHRVDGSLDIFNALNGNVVLTENQAFGSSLGRPDNILQPRLLRISAQWKF